MEKLTFILSTAGTVVGLSITTLACLYKWIKNSKAKKIAENIIKIGSYILPYIEKAEQFVSFTGEEKKAYVMTKANQYAIDNGIKFDEEKTSEKIDEIVALCKEVNVNGTKEEAIACLNPQTEEGTCFSGNETAHKQKNIIG